MFREGILRIGHNKRVIAFYVAIALLLCFTMFVFSDAFIEMYVISKWYAFIGFGLLFSFIIVAIQSKQVIIINTVDLLLILLAVYVLIRVIADDNIYKQTNTLSAVIFVLIYYSFKVLSNPPLKHFNLLVVVVCTLQSIYGLIQGCAENEAYNVVGSFDNPAGFAGVKTVYA